MLHQTLSLTIEKDLYHYDFFEEWSEFTDVVGFGTQRATAKEILCQFVKDIAEFFSDVSEEYPSKKYESEV